MPEFTRGQIARAQHCLAHPDPHISPVFRALRERIARHVLASTGVQRDRKVVTVPRAVFEAGLRGQRLTGLEGGAQ